MEAAAIAHRALRRWDDFPLDTPPRPIVLVGERIQFPRFSSVQAKNAAFSGQFDASSRRVPSAVGAGLRSFRDAQPADGYAALRILVARRSHARFLTDRGLKLLAAWELEIEQALGPAYLLDPAVDVWAPPDMRGEVTAGGVLGAISTRGTVSVGKDGRSISCRVIGLPGRPPRGKIEVYETRTAAIAIVVARRTGNAVRPAAAVGVEHQLDAVLNEPLGDRVLVDVHGNPCEVRPNVLS